MDVIISDILDRVESIDISNLNNLKNNIYTFNTNNVYNGV